MAPEAIRRCATMPKGIDESADLICGISSVFFVFEEWGDDRVAISAFARGKLQDLANRHACRILKALEDFAPAREGGGGGLRSVWRRAELFEIDRTRVVSATDALPEKTRKIQLTDAIRPAYFSKNSDLGNWFVRAAVPPPCISFSSLVGVCLQPRGMTPSASFAPVPLPSDPLLKAPERALLV